MTQATATTGVSDMAPEVNSLFGKWGDSTFRQGEPGRSFTLW